MGTPIEAPNGVTRIMEAITVSLGHRWGWRSVSEPVKGVMELDGRNGIVHLHARPVNKVTVGVDIDTGDLQHRSILVSDVPAGDAGSVIMGSPDRKILISSDGNGEIWEAKR